MSTLYRKYRPKKFAQISGQTHIVRTLTGAVEHDRIGQAYLFTGPRGTGKTTLARIFAKTLNCLDPQKQEGGDIKVEPCGQCEHCKLIMENKAIDLVEIDAASHTGVDNIRQLKETVNLPPTKLKFKVYIIDEVHMLSMGAFNALLKTLEEPPAHVIFILATTELQKVPETIVSRCQRFDFSRLSNGQIVDRLSRIAQEEKVEVEKEALETIAMEAEGGMRDAESIFGQIISLEDKKITSSEVNQILGTSSKKLAIDFIGNLLAGKIDEVLLKIDQLQADGVNLRNFNKNCLDFLRNLLIIKTLGPEKDNQAEKLATGLSREQLASSRKTMDGTTLAEILMLTDLFQKSLNSFKDSPIPQLPLEIAAIEFNLSRNLKSKLQNPDGDCIQAAKENVSPPAEEPKVKQSQSGTFENPSSEMLKKNSAAEIPAKKPAAGSATNVGIETVLDKWSEILEGVKPHNHSIHAFLKNCVPAGMLGGKLYIKTKYDFYKDKLNEIPNRLTVQKVVANIVGSDVDIAFITENDAGTINFESQKGEKRNILHDAMQMFGGKIIK